MTKKFICTLGPSSLNVRTIERLNHLKVDLFRINLSHTPVEQISPIVELIRAHSTVPICLDTQGAQARTGDFIDGSIGQWKKYFQPQDLDLARSKLARFGISLDEFTLEA